MARFIGKFGRIGFRDKTIKGIESWTLDATCNLEEDDFKPLHSYTISVECKAAKKERTKKKGSKCKAVLIVSKKPYCVFNIIGVINKKAERASSAADTKRGGRIIYEIRCTETPIMTEDVR